MRTWAIWVTGVNSLGEIWFWELAGARWLKRDIEIDRLTLPLLLDGGVWLLRRGGTFGYLKDAVFTAIPGLSMVDGAGGRVLRDGTVLLYSGDDILLGAGTGTQREWVRIKL